MTRLDGVHITGGDLGYELAMRRSRATIPTTRSTTAARSSTRSPGAVT